MNKQGAVTSDREKSAEDLNEAASMFVNPWKCFPEGVFVPLQGHLEFEMMRSFRAGAAWGEQRGAERMKAKVLEKLKAILELPYVYGKNHQLGILIEQLKEGYE